MSVAANFFISGFDRARSQLELKAPEVNLSFLDVAKVVKDGELVEESDDEEEEHKDEEVDQPAAVERKEAEPPNDAATIVIEEEEEEDPMMPNNCYDIVFGPLRSFIVMPAQFHPVEAVFFTCC